eukprot:scpid73997/ scgid28438/ Methylmalonic aciduria and homocystinuria type D homolog, mitochondrial
MAKVTTCMTNIRVLLNNMRMSTSVPATFAALEGATNFFIVDSRHVEELSSPEPRVDRFAAVDTQSVGAAVKKSYVFPMPGLVGPNMSSDRSSVEFLRATGGASDAQPVEDDMSMEEFQKALSNITEDMTVQPMGKPSPFGQDLLECECSVQTVNRRVQRSMMEMFPEAPALPRDGLTIMTVSQHTHANMSNWSDSVAEERDDALARFLVIAKSACGKLMAAGYWADFVDPHSGRAFYASHTNNTLTETDERMRHLGYTVEDLGCCKCLSHPKWGTHVFGGVLVTNAPVDSPALASIIGNRS